MLVYNSHFSIRETGSRPANETQVKGSEEQTLVYKQGSALGWKEDRAFVPLPLSPPSSCWERRCDDGDGGAIFRACDMKG